VAVGRTLLRRCDRRLGDERCRFDLQTSGFFADAEVGEALADAALKAAGLGGFAAGWFVGGSLTWTSGPNAGDVASVKADALGADGLRRIELWRRPGAPMAPGHGFRLSAGCDKSPGACRQKFGNFLNFRGFPDIPGDDWVAAYPKNGQVHDGASRRNG
jgi:uncharacterized phage protein (TIGR02218 family)